MKLTRQGVRDLNDPEHKPEPPPDPVVFSGGCAHKRMRTCHRGCGHYFCPDCGLTWDEGAEK